MSFVQSATGAAGSGTASAISVTATFGAATGAGHLLIATISWDFGTSATVSEITDTQGNTWTRATGIVQTGDGQAIDLWYAINTAGGSAATVTAVFSYGAVWREISIVEYSGIATTAALDVVASAIGTGTAPSSGTATTTANGDLVVGALYAGNITSLTAGTGFTVRQSSPDKLTNVEDEVQTTAGSVAATWTIAASQNWAALMATFKASGGSAAALAGNAADVSSATGALTTQIKVAAAAVDVATATGTLSTGIPLSGAAASISTAHGQLSTQIRLSAAALSNAAATAGLTTSVILAAAAQDVSSASAQLTAGASSLAANAASLSTATANLLTQIELGASASDISTATAQLNTIIRMSGGASGNSTASALLNTAILLGANAQSQSTAAGIWVNSGSGVLGVAYNSPPASVVLSDEGTLDWAHWGYSGITQDHKVGGSPQISDITQIGSVTPFGLNDNNVLFSWVNGTPTASVTNTNTGIRVTGVGNGFQITVPADTTQRVLKLYVSVYRCRGELDVSISDISSAPYTDTSLYDGSSVTTERVYSITYSANSAGQTLTIEWTMNTDYTGGSLHLKAADLALAPSSGMSAAATDTSLATAALLTGIKLAGAASSQAMASASLTTSVILAAAAQDQSAASAALNTAIRLAASGQAVSAASGTLNTAITLDGNAISQSTASANLLSPGAGLSAAALSASSASASLTTAIRMMAAASSISTATGALSGATAQLQGVAVSASVAAGNLTTRIQLSASALSQAIAGGGLTTNIRLDASALSSALMIATLGSGPGIGLVVIPHVTRATAIRTIGKIDVMWGISHATH